MIEDLNMTLEYKVDSTEPIFDRNKFIVVGNPDITDDGIASGFSSSNYLLVNNTGIDNTAPSWKITSAFTTNLTGNYQEIWCEKVSNQAQCYIRIDTSNKLRIFLMADDSTTIINYVLGSTVLSDNTNYLVETIYTGTSYQILLTNLNTGVTTTEASVTSAKKIRDISTLSIGVSGLNTPGNPNAGSIDLKEFSITVDGNLVFSGVQSQTVVQGYNSGVDSDGSRSSVRLYAEGNRLNASFKETDKLVLTKAGEDLDFYRNGVTKSSTSSAYYYGWRNEVLRYNPDVFIVEGSTPTISADGIASGFSTSKYLSVNIPAIISTSDTFEYDVRFTTPVSFSGQQIIWASSNSYRIYQGSSGACYCTFWGQSVSFQMNANTTYQVKFIYDGSNIYAKYKKDTDTAWSATNTTAISSGTTQNNPTITIGSNSGSNVFNGSIDLKYFVVTVSGIKVFSGSTTESTNVWTLDQYPNSQSEIIELNSNGNLAQVLTDYTFKSFTNGTKYTKTLSAPLVQNKKYTSNILADSSNVTVSTQIEDSTPYIDSFPISNNLEGVDSFYFGVNKALSGTLPNTAFSGTIYLSAISGSYNGTSFDTVSEEVRTTSTKDFIYIPDLPYNSYAFKNLDNMASFNVLDKAFSGNEESDGIDFNNPNGFSLCFKVSITDLHDKLFFVKRFGAVVYCSFALKNNELIFTLNMKNSENPVTLGYVIQPDNHTSFTKNDVLITITASVQESYVNFSMYKNNELLNSSLVQSPQFLDNASNYKLYNYSEDTPTGDEKLYVSNIVSFTGVLSENQLYYLTNIMDTNF